MCVFFQKPTNLLRHKYLLSCLVLAPKEMELLGISFGLVYAENIAKSVMSPNVCEPPKLWKMSNCFG